MLLLQHFICIIPFFSLSLPFSEIKVAYFSSDVFRTVYLVVIDDVSYAQKVKSTLHGLFEFFLPVHDQLGKVIQKNQLDATIIY